jgi:NADH/F420H2 dehydrogenase subunit C
MDGEALKSLILEWQPAAQPVAGMQYLQVAVEGAQLRELMQQLRSDSRTSFDYMFCVTGVDYPPTHMEVVYHLKSSALGHSLVVKGRITGRDNPEIDTMSDLWRTAEFHEREVYDLLGIRFRNHPDLRRIFLTDDWQGWPLRKDYADPVNIVEL